MAATRLAERTRTRTGPGQGDLPAPPLPRGALTRLPMPAGKIIGVGLVCFLVWSLLDARSLLTSAEAGPLGARRTAALAVLRPLAGVSSALGLDRVVRTVQEALGRRDTTPGGGPVAVPHPGAPSQPEVIPTFRSGRSSPPSPSRPERAALPALRIPTRAHPLRVLVVGDSLGQDFGYALSGTLGTRYVVHVDGHTSSGLARPDYFNWPAELQVDIQRFRPEVIVAMMGANDATQGFIFRGRPVLLGTRAWAGAYRTRVEQFMGVALRGGRRRLLWVGMPIMANPALSARLRTVNWIDRTEAGQRRAALFVDAWHLFVDGKGRYAAYLPSSSGKVEQVRMPDGIHLSPTGSGRLASYAFALMRRAWDLPR